MMASQACNALVPAISAKTTPAEHLEMMIDDGDVTTWAGFKKEHASCTKILKRQLRNRAQGATQISSDNRRQLVGFVGDEPWEAPFNPAADGVYQVQGGLQKMWTTPPAAPAAPASPYDERLLKLEATVTEHSAELKEVRSDVSALKTEVSNHKASTDKGFADVLAAIQATAGRGSGGGPRRSAPHDAKWTADNVPICLKCGKEGHIRAR